MSREHAVEVVRIGEVEKHPNADTLSTTLVHGGYPVAFRTGEYKPGDLAVYVPVDSMVPADDPRWAFLDGKVRIRARRLRGLFSMGLLTPADPSWVEGQDVANELRIRPYEPEVDLSNPGLNERDVGVMPTYTDIEGYRRFKNFFAPGEHVVVTEKIHGENFRAVHDGDRLWVGSRTRIKARADDSKWWQAAASAGLEEKLARFPHVAVYGECHGYTGGFPYGTGRVPTLRVFDAMDMTTRRFLNRDEFAKFVQTFDLLEAPVLHIGPWDESLLALAEGKSTLDSSHVREGIVIKPIVERHDPRLGRGILKLHGQGFLLRSAA